jgi:flavodoxin
MKCLVVYYSRTGTTAKVADAIAETLGADVEQLSETTTRHKRGLMGFLRGCRDALKKRSSTLSATKFNPIYYDVVILGTPVWTGSLPPAMRSYLDTHGQGLTRIAVFCTTDVSGIENTLDQMVEACTGEVLARMGLKRKTVNKKIIDEPVSEFCRRIQTRINTPG